MFWGILGIVLITQVQLHMSLSVKRINKSFSSFMYLIYFFLFLSVIFNKEVNTVELQ